MAKLQKKAGTFGDLKIKYYFCRMKERINWIDWGKALAVITVVFCHLPQSQEWFYYRYLQTCIISIFFFLSGYLKKDHGSDKENWKKYWNGLIIPYLLYNAIVYPYWFVKYYLLHGGMPDLLSAMRPIIGALLFQHENAFCEPLDGPLWYLPAILAMHIIVDLCRKTQYQHIILIVLCVLSYFVYAGNKFWNFLPNLTFIGTISRLPIYYIGYAMGQKKQFRNINPIRHLCFGLVLMLVSIAFFHWHLQLFYYGKMSQILSTEFLLHIGLFYPVNICFAFGVLYFCKVLDGIHSKMIVNLSIGTLVIIGLHIVFITIVNFALEKLLHIHDVICYHWYEALPIALLITAILYPVILWGKKYAPVLLGKKRF